MPIGTKIDQNIFNAPAKPDKGSSMSARTELQEDSRDNFRKPRKGTHGMNNDSFNKNGNNAQQFVISYELLCFYDGC